MSAWRATLMQTRSRLKIHAGLTMAAAIAILSVLVILGSGPALEFRLAMLACTLLMLGQSIHLFFDAALFHLGLASDSEEAALLSIDRTLDAMGLRPMPGQTRPLMRRIAGTKRLLRRQYLVLCITLAMVVFSLLEGRGP